MNVSRVVDFTRIRSLWCYGHYMPVWRSLPGCIKHNSNAVWPLSTTLPWGRALPSLVPPLCSLSLSYKRPGALSECNLYLVIYGPTSAFTYPSSLSTGRWRKHLACLCFFALPQKRPLVRLFSSLIFLEIVKEFIRSVLLKLFNDLSIQDKALLQVLLKVTFYVIEFSQRQHEKE